MPVSKTRVFPLLKRILCQVTLVYRIIYFESIIHPKYQIMKLSYVIGTLFICLIGYMDVSAQLSWVRYNSSIPSNFVKGGRENGRDIPICRCTYQGGTHPGKVIAGKCNIGYGGSEYAIRTFEILVNNGNINVGWQSASGSRLPANAYQGGSEGSRKLYIGKATYKNGTHTGIVFAPCIRSSVP